MATQPLVQGPLFGAPVSRLDFTRREFVKTPSPSPESSPEKEEAIHDEPRKMAVETAAGGKAKHSAASGSDIVSPAGARGKEGAIRGEFDPFDFFDVLDMLGEDGFGIDDGVDLTVGEPKAVAVAVAVVKKHPVGCRQRNVVRRMVCPSLDRGDFDDPFLSKNRAALMEMVEKEQAQSERERLEYLKNAR